MGKQLDTRPLGVQTDYTKRQLNKMSDKELKNIVRSMGKRLNQRLTEIEKQGYTETEAYKRIKAAATTAQKTANDEDLNMGFNGSYRVSRAANITDPDNIKEPYTPTVPRFNTAVSYMTREEMVKHILTMQKFQQDKRSTISGIEEVWGKTMETLGKAYPQYTKQQISKAVRGNALQFIMSKQYGSEVALYIVTTAGNEKAWDYIDDHYHLFEEGGHVSDDDLQKDFDDWYAKYSQFLDADDDLLNSMFNAHDSTDWL